MSWLQGLEQKHELGIFSVQAKARHQAKQKTGQSLYGVAESMLCEQVRAVVKRESWTAEDDATLDAAFLTAEAVADSHVLVLA